MAVTRRAMLRASAATGLASVAAGGAYLAGVFDPRSPPVNRFSVPLPVPEVLAPLRSDGGADYYEITQRLAEVEIFPGLRTKVWSYNGTFPGPTIHARRGRKAVIRHVNYLPVPTVVHLHGGVTPPESDGFPTDLIVPTNFARDVPLCSAVPSLNELARRGTALPANARVHEYPNDQRAATLWYHDHAMDFTARNTYMGLAGFYLISDDEEAALALPRGRYDIPLMIALRQFDAGGAIVHQDQTFNGAAGDVALVNGAPWPKLAVERRKYRLRILNASNGTTLTVALSSGKPLAQIATDGGLLPAPVAVDAIPLAMAERAEVVVDFAEYPAGTSLMLIDRESPDGPSGALVRFDVTGGDVAGDRPLPASLAGEEPLLAPARKREFVFGGALRAALVPWEWQVNGHVFAPDHVQAQPKLGEVEEWRLVNEASLVNQMVHPVHIHLVHFRIIERNGGPPLPNERGWKDTVRLGVGDDVRILARFDGYRGRYVIHCHNLGHEDNAMMARFDVV